MTHTCFIDLDHTLFDTTAWHYFIAQHVCKKFKIAPEIYFKAYEEMRDRSGVNAVGDPMQLAQLLTQKYQVPVSVDDFSREWYQHGLESADFIYDDSLNFLEALGVHGVRRVLLSRGNPKIQQLKLQGTGLSDCVDEVIIVEDEKYSPLVKHLEEADGETFFVNDHVGENKEIAAKFPDVIVIPISRNAEKCPDGVCETLDEALEFIVEGFLK
ncbi:MAG: hypothetical protein HW383_244 [Candidatus Magasanikbacteria bacterium]|nr:hypothetical protein [Candidatus Magasanikbacteria bacterium]